MGEAADKSLHMKAGQGKDLLEVDKPPRTEVVEVDIVDYRRTVDEAESALRGRTEVEMLLIIKSTDLVNVDSWAVKICDGVLLPQKKIFFLSQREG